MSLLQCKWLLAQRKHVGFDLLVHITSCCIICLSSIFSTEWPNSLKKQLRNSHAWQAPCVVDTADGVAVVPSLWLATQQTCCNTEAIVVAENKMAVGVAWESVAQLECEDCEVHQRELPCCLLCLACWRGSKLVVVVAGALVAEQRCC